MKYYRVLFNMCAALTIIGCNELEIPEAEVASVTAKSAVSVQTLFADPIERDSLHAESNNFYTDSMIAIKPLTDTTFSVTNFTPMIQTGVTVTAKLEGVSAVLKLITIDTLQPHTRLTFRYPTADGISLFQTTDGRVAELDPSRGFPASATSLDFLADSDKLRMLKAIKMHWLIDFNDYAQQQPTHPSWEPVRPAQARLYTALMLNVSYLFSQDEYRERFLKVKFYKNMIDSTREVPADQWFTQAETDALYESLKNRTFQVGIVSGGGLGGGQTLGVSNGTLTGQYNFKWNDSLETIDYFPESYYTGPHPLLSHEMGHCLGYGHNSNVCSTGRMGPAGTPEWQKMFGFPAVSNLMHSKYLNYNLFPCLKSEYYVPTDFDFQQPTHGSAW